MNLVFLKAKILSNIKFDFIVKNKEYKSIVNYEIELLNNSEIIVQAYNKDADYCYKELSKGDYVFLQGILQTQGTVRQIDIIKI